MWQDILRLAIGWGGAAGLCVFWYWIMDKIGTF